jgi:hypothetical protein
LATLKSGWQKHISDGIGGYGAGSVLVVDSYRVNRAVSDPVVGTIHGKMGNSDHRILDKNLRGCWKAKNVRNAIGDEAATRHYHHGGIRRSKRNADKRQILAYYRHLLGVVAGANPDRASGGDRSYRRLNVCEVDKRRLAGGVADGDYTCKGISAEDDKNDQSQTRERETTVRAHFNVPPFYLFVGGVESDGSRVIFEGKEVRRGKKK